MTTWDVAAWQGMFLRTREYLWDRLQGHGCDRPSIEAWRHFYRTHEPMIRRMVGKGGLTDGCAAACIRDIWLEIITGVPRLEPPFSQDTFRHWLSQVVQSQLSISRQRLAAAGTACAGGSMIRPDAADGNGTELPLEVDATQADELVEPATLETFRINNRLYQMRIVEERSVDDVARALGLSCRQVVDRQRRMLGKILSIMIRMDA